MVKGLTKETFDTIYAEEAWIVENAGSSMLKKTLRRVEHKAKSYGVEVKPGFLSGHKVLAKQATARAAFLERKAEEVKAAEE